MLIHLICTIYVNAFLIIEFIWQTDTITRRGKDKENSVKQVCQTNIFTLSSKVACKQWRSIFELGKDIL